ncbi:2'-5' RNA ligase family protein [Novosphingobium sp. 1949]|uniref:2'-5' RNA ligase family protein n=1 Tax=Novosphingobium organovorum TaxID=2930092 RepID=A0ABT0B884_9SPHN|nr:2'-5' RNA ligase family protein [Novosphingobium organovorum]MCJ2181287.1 2'-5' RNA ligase family protein [Novosphingobium organovorum]
MNRAGKILGAARPSGAPLVVAAELPGDVLAWANALRQAHYPAERNHLRAHVTLFYALPPSVEDEVVQYLADFSRQPPPPASIDGLMTLEQGTAIRIKSPALERLHAAFAERLHGLLTRQDMQPLRLHVTIQNKVSRHEARALQAEIGPKLPARRFRFRGLGLYAWEEGLWHPIRLFTFRG